MRPAGSYTSRNRISSQVSRPSRKGRRAQRPARLGIEILEERLMLANGDEFPDVISVGRVLSSWSAADVQNHELKITYSVYNQQGAEVSGVLLTTTLEPGVTFVTASQLPDRSGQELAWSLGTLAAFGRTTVEVTVSLADPVPLVLDDGAEAFGTVNARAVTDNAPPARLRSDPIDPNLLRSTPDASITDPFILAKAAELDHDPERIFEFLTHEVGYESYVGSLRGARGTLWSSAGNALDEASLGIALLRSSGIPARYVQGTLSDTLAQELILSMFPSSFQTIGFIPAGAAIADPANDAQLLTETRQHFWMQFDAGSGFTDADPTFAIAQIGQTFTTSLGAFTEVPDNLRHKVTVRLKRELTTPLSGLFGAPAQDVATVLSETFNTAELVGRPISIGHLVEHTSLGALFTAVTNRYSPYIAVGDFDSDPEQAHFVRGQDYQEVLTNFPFGSQILTGVFLEIDLTGPDGPAETFERTLADRIGFAVRQNGGSPSVAVDPDGVPLLSDLDVFTLHAVPSLNAPSFPGQLPASLRRLAEAYSEIRTENPPTSDAAARFLFLSRNSLFGLTRAIGGAFLTASDFLTTQLADSSLVKAYFDRPRLILVSARTTHDLNAQTATSSFAIDLRRDSIRSVAFPGQRDTASREFNGLRGISENITERDAVAFILSENPQSRIINTATVFEAALDQGIELAVITADTLASLDTLAISPEAKARISLSALQGKTAVVPIQAVLLEGEPTIAWYEIDVVTGETIGVTEDGGHQVILYIAGLAIFFAGLNIILKCAPFTTAAWNICLTQAGQVVNNAATAAGNAGADAAGRARHFLEVLPLTICRAANAILNFIDGKLPGQQGFRFKCNSPLQGARLGPLFLQDPSTALLPRLNSASAQQQVSAGLVGGSVSGAIPMPAFALSNQLAATWATGTVSDFLVTSLNAPSASVRDAAGLAVGSGSVTLTAAVAVPTGVSGNVTYDVAGLGTLSFYAPATSNLGVSGEWTSYNATLSGDATLQLMTDSLTLNGDRLPAGTYTITTNAATLTGSGPSTSPGFVGAVTINVTDGIAQLGSGIGNLTVGGGAVDTSSGLTLAGFNGTAAVTAGGSTDVVSLNGAAAHVLRVSANVTALSTDQNSPATFNVAVETSLVDTYTVQVHAPPGWTLNLSDTGQVTVKPSPGLQGGTYSIRLVAQSMINPELVAQGEVMVTVTPTVPGIEFSVEADPLLFVPFSGAQVPTAFQAAVQNLGPQEDTFVLTFPAVPAGFEILGSRTTVTIPAGETGIVGIYLEPSGQLPLPGTPASFDVTVTSTTDPSVVATETRSFVMPVVHGVTLVADPVVLSTIPGAGVTAMLTVSAVGNVAESVTFEVDTSSGLTIDGISPVALGVGATTTLMLTLTPDAGTPLNSTLEATITANFDGRESVTTIPVRVAAPGADAIGDAATAAETLGNAALASRLHDLSIALTNLVQTSGSEVFKSQALASIDSALGLLAADPILSTFVNDITAGRDALAAATTSTEIQTAVQNLGNALDAFGDTVSSVAKHNFEVFLLPNTQVAQPQTPATFDLRIHNIGTDPSTYNITVLGLPAGVTGEISQRQVTLARDEFASVAVTITQTSTDEVLPFDFQVAVSVDGFPDIAKTASGSFTARQEFLSVVSVSAAPPFTDGGGQIDVSARVLNAVNREQSARASFIVRDSRGQQVGPASSPVDVTLTVQTSLVTVPLGSIDTTGLANGSYSIEVTLTDMLDQPILGGRGTGNFLVGSPVTASIDLSPDVLPPGTSTVTNTLEIQATALPLNPPVLVGQAAVAGASDAVRNGDFVYVAGTAGISVFDIAGTNAENPQLQRVVGTRTEMLKIRGNLLVAVRGGQAGTKLDTYSLTEPANPQFLGSTGEIPYMAASDLLVTDTHAFIVLVNLHFFANRDIFDQNGGVIAINITNPAVPFFDGDAVSARGTPAGRDGVNDGVLFNENGTNNDGVKFTFFVDQSGGNQNTWSIVQVAPTIAYVMGSSATGTNTQAGVGLVRVVDISDPRNMRLIRDLQIPGTVQMIGIALDGDTALVTGSEGGWNDFAQDFSFTGDAVLATLDVSDPANPQIVHTQEIPFAGGGMSRARVTSLGGRVFTYGAFEMISAEPALFLVDGRNPNDLDVSRIDAPAEIMRLSSDANLIFTADLNSLIIYRVRASEPFTLLGVQPISGGSHGVAGRNDIAYACGPNGIQVIDYSDPAVPSIQGTIAGNHYGCHVQDNVLLALRPVGNSSILDVYALQNTPLAPPLIGSSPVINYNLLNDIKSNGTHAFITQLNVCFFIPAGDIYHHGGDLLSIALNLNDSFNPTSAAPTLDSVLFNTNGDNTFDPSDVTGCAENGGDHNVFGVALANPQTAYLASTTVTGGDTQTGVGRVKVVDVSNPASPAVVRELDIPGTVQTIGIGISDNVGVVIGSTGGWQDNPNGNLTGNLTVTTLDVSDPLNPRIVSSRTLPRITATFWSNFVTLGNPGAPGFAYSNLAFANGQGAPAVLLIDASNPRSPLIGQTDVPLDSVQPNSLSTDGKVLLTADASGISIYEINGLPGLAITARVQIPNGTGVAIVPGSFNIPPTEILAGADFDTLVWDLTLTATETITWDSTVSDMQPGESRAVTLDTTIDFGFQGTPGQVQLPPQSVVSEQVLALEPASRTVQPGEPAPFTVTIVNPATLDVTYDLSVAGLPPEWVDFPAQVTVPAGGTVDLDLTLMSDPFAPEAAFGFVVTATRTGVSGSVEGTLNLVGDPVLPVADPDSHGVVVSVSPTQATAGQVTTANYTARVTNTGSVTDTFDLALAGLPVGFAATFFRDGVEVMSIEVPPGASNFRELLLVIVPPGGTPMGDYAFTVSAASTTEAGITDDAAATVTVLAVGVDVDIMPSSGTPGGTLQMRVTNTGQVAGTFDLAVAAPVALVATLGSSSVTLGPGQSQLVPIAVGDIDFAFPGSLPLVGVATSRSNSAVRDAATANVAIAAVHGMTAEFDPGTRTLPAPGETSFVLLVHNTGNLEEEFTATIVGINGPIVASLAGLDGQPTQSIPIFRLPGLSTGAILLNANLTDVGQGTVDVQVKSLDTGSELTARAAAIVEDQTPAGITVNPASSLVTNEAGGQAVFTVVLDSVPIANVTVNLTSSDASEGTVSPAQLVFTPQNALTPQTVTITGANDDLVDGNVAYTIITSAMSADQEYDGIAVADVAVTNTDNDEEVASGCTAPLETEDAEGGGDVRARIAGRRLVIRGDTAANALRVEAEAGGESFVVTGLDRTRVNGRTGPVRFQRVRAIDIGMGSGNDSLFLAPAASGGAPLAIDALLESGLTIRMDAGDDELAVCGLAVSGRVHIGAGRGADRYLIDDSDFRAPATIGSGNERDTILIDTRGETDGPPTLFRRQSSIRGKSGRDRIRLGRRGEPGNSVEFRGPSDVS